MLAPPCKHSTSHARGSSCQSPDTCTCIHTIQQLTSGHWKLCESVVCQPVFAALKHSIGRGVCHQKSICTLRGGHIAQKSSVCFTHNRPCKTLEELFETLQLHHVVFQKHRRTSGVSFSPGHHYAWVRPMSSATLAFCSQNARNLGSTD